MRRVEIYSTSQCPYCLRAKALLDARDVAYTEIDVSANRQMMQHMIERSGQRTVPQIFIDGEAVGGYQQLSLLDSLGQLD
jgi:glutaredoxin 3